MCDAANAPTHLRGLSSSWHTLFWAPCNKQSGFKWTLDKATVNTFNSAGGIIANTNDDCSAAQGFQTNGYQASSYLDKWVAAGGSASAFELWMRPRDNQQQWTQAAIDQFYKCVVQTWPTTGENPPPKKVTGVACILDKGSANTCLSTPPAGYQYAIMNGPYIMRGQLQPADFPNIKANLRFGEMYEPTFMGSSCNGGTPVDQSKAITNWLHLKSGFQWGSWGVPMIGNMGADCKTPYSNLPAMVTQLKSDFASHSDLSNLKNLGLYC